jgi:hypothetical protein
LHELDQCKEQLQQLTSTLDNDSFPLQYSETQIDKTVLLGIAKEVKNLFYFLYFVLCFAYFCCSCIHNEMTFISFVSFHKIIDPKLKEFLANKTNMNSLNNDFIYLSSLIAFTERNQQTIPVNGHQLHEIRTLLENL